MAVDYTGLAAKAKVLIETNGRSVTLRKTDRDPADAAKPWNGNAAVPTDVTAIVVFDTFSVEEIDDDHVQRGDQKVYVAASSVGSNDLTTFDTLLDGADVYKIMGVNQVTPGATDILYMLQVRR